LRVIMAVLVWFLLYRSTKGYELRAVGFNRDAAEFAGINVNKNITEAMVIAGALAGLAGALTITGTAPHKISTLAAFEKQWFQRAFRCTDCRLFPGWLYLRRPAVRRPAVRRTKHTTGCWSPYGDHQHYDWYGRVFLSH
jgi:hypothetical protein